MKVLFDQGTPAPLRRALIGHSVDTAYELGWSTLQNGELINAAESAAYDILVTTDKNLKYQQNLKTRVLTIVVLSTTSWPRIQASIEQVLAVVDSAGPGGYVEVAIK